MSALHFQVGDLVRIRPEWGGEHEPVHVVVEWNGDRGLIAPTGGMWEGRVGMGWANGPIRPQEAVSAEMIELAFPRPEIRKSRSAGARPTETEQGDQDHA